MRKTISGAALTLALCLAGCEDGAPERGTISVKVENPFDTQLKALSEGSRHLALYRAIRDGGQRCKRVDGGGYQESYKTMAMWTAHCTDSGDWSIFIAPNGDVQVRKCSDAETLGLPECRAPAARGAAPPASDTVAAAKGDNP